MKNERSTRTGFTKSGFTKAGFGCCSHYKQCQMGKLTCFYQESDPEVQNYCSAFLRNHRSKVEKIVEPVAHELNEELPQEEGEQLSLF